MTKPAIDLTGIITIEAEALHGIIFNIIGDLKRWDHQWRRGDCDWERVMGGDWIEARDVDKLPDLILAAAREESHTPYDAAAKDAP